MEKKMCRATIRAVAFLSIIGGCFALAQSSAQDRPEIYRPDYKIGPRDLLEITVQEDPKLKALEARVSEEGKVNLPYIGEVEVQGLTAAELEKKLALLFEAYFQGPHVFVRIKEFLSNQVSVLGAVAKPGFVQLQGRMTLLEAITAAGGLTREAALEMIIFRQALDGSALNLHIPIDDLMIRGDPKYNIPLESGDNIVVQVDRLVQIYIYGAVRNPGALSVYKSRIPTLRQAIAQAGGFTDRASKKNVVVTRRDATGNEKKTTVNIKDIESGKSKDFQLEENDTVYVKESWF
jgi:polysaccharide export outer membrane protein